MSEPATDDYVTISKSSFSDVVLPTVDHVGFAQDRKAQHALLALLYEKLAIEHRTSNHQLFLDLDPDRQGVLGPTQFRQALADVGVPLTAEQLEWLVQSFDLNRDQGLDYSEFVRLLGASRAGKVGGAATGVGKTGLEWGGSPFQVMDEAREEVRVCACGLLQRFIYGIRRSIDSIYPLHHHTSTPPLYTTTKTAQAPRPRALRRDAARRRGQGRHGGRQRHHQHQHRDANDHDDDDGGGGGGAGRAAAAGRGGVREARRAQARLPARGRGRGQHDQRGGPGALLGAPPRLGATGARVPGAFQDARL